MPISDTASVVQMIVDQPEIYHGFFAEVGGDPEQYDLDLADLLPPAKVDVNETLARIFGESAAVLPAIYPEWQQVDLDHVDWVAVFTEVSRRLY